MTTSFVPIHGDLCPLFGSRSPCAVFPLKKPAVSCNTGFPVWDQDKDAITVQAIMLDFLVILWYNQDTLVEASIFYD